MASVYYLATVRMPARVLATSGMHRAFGWGATALAAASVVVGLAIVGSPLGERARKLDELRVDHLRGIEREIDRLCLGPERSREEGAPTRLVHPLPASLPDLAASAVDNRPQIVDPVTRAPYEYRTTGASSYELCGTFVKARDDDDDPRWNHPAGRHCWAYDVLKPD